MNEDTLANDTAANREGLKLHLRLIDVGSITYRAVTLRPSMGVRFSTNFFHETWHILTDGGGAHVLGRLMWGLSFQKSPQTLVVIDRPHLVTTPFDADPADRIIIAPSTTSTDAHRLRALGEALRRPSRPSCTIRFHTFGLPSAVHRPWTEWRKDRWKRDAVEARERMDRRAGMLCYTAHPETLRAEASMIYDMPPSEYGNYHYLDWNNREKTANGEVQVFSNFHDRVSAARVARREMLGDLEGPIADDAARWAVQMRAEDGRSRLARARKAHRKQREAP